MGLTPERGKVRYARLNTGRMLGIEIDGMNTTKEFSYDGDFKTEFDDEDGESGFAFSGDRPADLHCNTVDEEWVTRPRKIKFDGCKAGADVEMEFETYLPSEEKEDEVQPDSKQEHVAHGKVIELIGSPDEISLTILIQFADSK